MALESTPPSIAWDGNLKITFLPSSVSTPSSVASLTGGTAVDITYSLTPDGFNHTTTEATVTDGRLTLKQILDRPGTFTETLEIKYVSTNVDANDKARVALIEGTTGFLVYRYGVPNATAYTATTQKVDIYTIQAGKQRKDAPAANGLVTITQTIYLTATTQNEVALVA